MTQKLVIAIVIFITGSLLGTPKESPPSSQFEIEKGLLDTLYQDSLSSTEMFDGGSTLSVMPQLSFVSARALILSNHYWKVPYSEQLGSMPAFSLHVSKAFANLGFLRFAIKGTVGYSYKQTVLSATQIQTGKDSRGILTLHWLPLSLGARIEYPLISFICPHIDLEGGLQWLYQSGKLDGIEQGFWVPFYQGAIGLLLFAPDQDEGSWFGGLNVGATIRNSFASQQSIQNWSLDVGLNVYL